tara:strand:- start:772 stop:948 length:177 start_codon:yes stop_codon:yes gene_type:complete
MTTAPLSPAFTKEYWGINLLISVSREYYFDFSGCGTLFFLLPSKGEKMVERKYCITIA